MMQWEYELPFQGIKQNFWQNSKAAHKSTQVAKISHFKYQQNKIL